MCTTRCGNGISIPSALNASQIANLTALLTLDIPYQDLTHNPDPD
jgi:hypothetical protein